MVCINLVKKKTKICIKCGVEKKVSEYYNVQSGICIECKCKEFREYYIKNKERRREYGKLYYKENAEKICDQHKSYCEKNKERVSDAGKRWRRKNQDRIRQYRRNQYKKDVYYRLRILVSNSIRDMLRQRGGRKNYSCLKYLLYTIRQLKDHLEKQFESWMSWKNYGVFSYDRDTWQIDHVIPHSSFKYDTMDCEEFKKCWALENLKPLKAIENILKSDRVEEK